MVSPETDFADERFAVGASLWTRVAGVVQQVKVARVAFGGKRPIVGFERASGMPDAERLAGAELRVPEEALAKLEPGAYYQHQLIGCRVETTSGAPIGEVVRVEGGTGASVLAVAGPNGEVLIPLAVSLCPTIDVERRLVVVEALQGFARSEPAGAARAAAGGEDERNGVRFDIVTVFPRMIEAAACPRASGTGGIESGVLRVRVHDLRDFTTDRHRTVDDAPYGGGPGMVMKVEPFVRGASGDFRGERAAGGGGAAVAAGPAVHAGRGAAAWRLGPRGAVVRALRGHRRAGARVVATEELSIGDFVLSGGETAALVVVDAVSRLVPGVVGDKQSVEEDSFSRGLLDHPHYTRPAEFEGGGAGGAALGASRRGAAVAQEARRWGGRWSGGRTCSTEPLDDDERVDPRDSRDVRERGDADEGDRR